MQQFIHCDGACQNPKEVSLISVGFVSRGEVVDEVVGQVVGKGTNNDAEYLAVLYALDHLAMKAPPNQVKVVVYTDSLLVEHQVKGEWEAKADNCKEYCREIQRRAAFFQTFEIRHTGREDNEEAHNAARNALKLAMA